MDWNGGMSGECGCRIEEVRCRLRWKVFGVAGNLLGGEA